jgi:hypothetical protein
MAFKKLREKIATTRPYPRATLKPRLNAQKKKNVRKKINRHKFAFKCGLSDEKAMFNEISVIRNFVK